MVEMIDNLLQLVVTAICAIVAACLAFRNRGHNEVVTMEESKLSSMAFFAGRREWILYAMFAVECFFGDLFYVLHLYFYGETPNNPYIPNLAWYASFLFLTILMLYVSDKKAIRMQTRLQLLVPAFTIGMGVFYVMYSGGIFDNILAAAVMTAGLWVAVGALKIEIQNKKLTGYVSEKYSLYMTGIATLVLEYSLWTISCFWIGDSITNPYFWVDIMFTLNFIVIMVAVKNVVSAENRNKTEVVE